MWNYAKIEWMAKCPVCSFVAVEKTKTGCGGGDYGDWKIIRCHRCSVALFAKPDKIFDYKMTYKPQSSSETHIIFTTQEKETLRERDKKKEYKDVIDPRD
jgi:hypothetical protein